MDYISYAVYEYSEISEVDYVHSIPCIYSIRTGCNVWERKAYRAQYTL